MSKRWQMGVVVAVALCVAFASAGSYAQEVDRAPRGGDRAGAPGPGGDQGPGGDRGGFRDRGPGGPGGNFDPAEFQQRMMDGLKARLEVSDEEWAVVGPLVTKVFEAQSDARAYAMGGGRGGFMMFGGDRGPGGPGAPGDTQGDRGPGASGGDRGGFMGRTDAPERDALAAAISSGTGVESKLEAYRAARDAKNAALKAAQEELRAVLTVKQEALLVLMGMLD